MSFNELYRCYFMLSFLLMSTNKFTCQKQGVSNSIYFLDNLTEWNFLVIYVTKFYKKFEFDLPCNDA